MKYKGLLNKIGKMSKCEFYLISLIGFLAIFFYAIFSLSEIAYSMVYSQNLSSLAILDKINYEFGQIQLISTVALVTWGMLSFVVYVYLNIKNQTQIENV